MKYLISILFFGLLVFAACSSGVDEPDTEVPVVDDTLVDDGKSSDEPATDDVIGGEDSGSSDEATNEILEEGNIDTSGAESILNEW